VTRISRSQYFKVECQKNGAYISLFFDAVEHEYRYVLLLSDKHLTTSYQSFVSAV